MLHGIWYGNSGFILATSYLHSPPISDVLYPRQTATARLLQALRKARASVHVPCRLPYLECLPSPVPSFRGVPQGQFLGNSILVQLSKSGSSLLRSIDSLHVSPRPWLPYEQGPCSLPTLCFTQCLAQKAPSLDLQTSQKHKILEAEETGSGNPYVS